MEDLTLKLNKKELLLLANAADALMAVGRPEDIGVRKNLSFILSAAAEQVEGDGVVTLLVDGMLNDIAVFQRDVIKTPMPDKPTMLSPARMAWAVKAFGEETQEFQEACEIGDLEGAADALWDLNYFVLGRLVEMGIAPRPGHEEVHRANMTKKRGALAKRGGDADDATKPDGWSPPDHSWLLKVTHADIKRLLDGTSTPNVIELTPAEVQSGYDRVAWAEGLIRQLPEAHDGRNSWLLNYGKIQIKESGAGRVPVYEIDTTPQKPAEFKGFASPLHGQDGRSALKRAEGKPDLGLIPYFSQEMEARVFMFGAIKHARWNHTKGLPWSVTLASLMRHVGRFNAGEDVDVESGLSHLAHAKSCCSMLLEWTQTHPELDDRRHVCPTGNGKVGAFEVPRA